MGYRVCFTDDEYYGADDINAIRSAIATKGVIKESADSCVVSIEGGRLRIAGGRALFGDGMMITVTDFEELDAADGYVYFDREILAPRVAASVPEGGVRLAQVSGEAVTDMREYSSVAVPSMAVNRYLSKTFTATYGGEAGTAFVKELEFEETSQFRYLVLTSFSYDAAVRVLYDFESGMRFGTRDVGPYGYVISDNINLPCTFFGSAKLEVTRSGNRAVVSITTTASHQSSYTVTVSVM